MPHLTDRTSFKPHLDWMRLKGLTDGTITARRRALTRMRNSAELEGLRPDLLDATPHQILAWAEARAREVEAPTLAAYLSHARSYYEWAVVSGLIEADPTVLLPSVKVGRSLPRPIAEDDLAAAIASAPARVRPWLALAAGCGLRCREIAHLRREDVHDEAADPVIHVTRDASKGRRARIVPVPAWVMAELSPWLGRRSRGVLFPRPYGRPGPIPPWRISQLGCKTLHEAGLPETMHQLRHRYATELYAVCHDIGVVQEMMGHATVQTTERYTKWDVSKAGEAVAAMRVPVEARPPRVAAMAAPLLCAVAVMHGAAAGAGAVHHSRRRSGAAIVQTWRGGGGRLTVS